MNRTLRAPVCAHRQTEIAKPSAGGPPAIAATSTTTAATTIRTACRPTGRPRTTSSACTTRTDTRSRAGAPPDGSTGRSGSAFKLSLTASGNGQARITARGRGVAVDVKPLPATQPVRVQLKNSNDQCWEATYSVPARRNTTGRFTDKND